MSQFTLLATTKKGNKPDFHKSAGGDKAKELYTKFFSRVQELYVKEKVKDGIFQAMMDVALVNDGPVGVDYRCEDGAVNIHLHCELLRLASMLTHSSAGHIRNRYRSVKAGPARRTNVRLNAADDGYGRFGWQDAEAKWGVCDAG